jgi:hypothetical protein
VTVAQTSDGRRVAVITAIAFATFSTTESDRQPLAFPAPPALQQLRLGFDFHDAVAMGKQGTRVIEASTSRYRTYLALTDHKGSILDVQGIQGMLQQHTISPRQGFELQ